MQFVCKMLFFTDPTLKIVSVVLTRARAFIKTKLTMLLKF